LRTIVHGTLSKKGRGTKIAAQTELLSRDRKEGKIMCQVFQPHTPVSEVAIMVRAHEIWVAAGRPKSDGRPFCSQAEQELRREAEPTVWNGKCSERVLPFLYHSPVR
jgi:hypothetical protein